VLDALQGALAGSSSAPVAGAGSTVMLAVDAPVAEVRALVGTRTEQHAWARPNDDCGRAVQSLLDVLAFSDQRNLVRNSGLPSILCDSGGGSAQLYVGDRTFVHVTL
jgi:hypothetical protein